MEPVSEHSFILNLEGEEPLKPLPSPTRRKRKLNFSKKVSFPDRYPAHTDKLFDVARDCSQMIEKVKDLGMRKKFNDDLTFMLVKRDHMGTLAVYMRVSQYLLGNSNEKTVS